MFRQIAFRLDAPGRKGREEVFAQHPAVLAAWLEFAYESARDLKAVPQPPLGHPLFRSNVPSIRGLFGGAAPGPLNAIAAAARLPFQWDHLIYAYMIENSRIYEVFRRVLFEFLHGEKLGVPFEDAQNWLRTTEELFYRDTAPFLITSVSSQIRPDLRAGRRNAYQRMFGMELNHGAEDGRPYPYVKTDAANGEFVATFEELLREVWVGMIYVTASSTSNPTDRSKVSELAEKLHDMLRSRRQNGNLSREEFAHVAAMSWFHMTIEFDSPIVRSLRAEATGVEQRLFKIAERVGLPAHGLSKHFFDIADDISRILIEIEDGRYNDPAAAPLLYTPAGPPGGPPSPEAAMRNIITHWTAITGRDVKARKVSAG